MLVDTDVLIWYMRGNKKAYNTIDKESGLLFSVVTYIELIQGIRNKKELNLLRRSLQDWNAKIIYITEDISVKALYFVEQHYLSYSLQLADALIAATAVFHDIPLLTGNDKHYKMIKNLQIKVFRP